MVGAFDNGYWFQRFRGDTKGTFYPVPVGNDDFWLDREDVYKRQLLYLLAMKIYNKILQAGLLSVALGSLFGCSVAGRLERHRTTASLSQLTRAERQQRQQDCRPQVVKLQRDSNRFYLAPVDTLADGERVMALQIEQVTVVAKARTCLLYTSR